MNSLFAATGDKTVPVASVADLLAEKHYLGEAGNGLFGWRDDFGVMVFANPRSRRLPLAWLELVRWCLHGEKNAGSRQWASFAAYARERLPVHTTVVSYSEPGHGHTGALYRAAGWLWAPTWHRLRPPPTGNGTWKSRGVAGLALPAGATEEDQTVKDRWVYLLRPDPHREAILALQDDAVRRRFPWAEYREPSWRRGRYDPAKGGGDYKRWASHEAE